MKNRTKSLCQSAVIAALYVVLTLIAASLGLANDAVQLRFSEALCILPYFTPAAIPGLFIGCLLSNLITGCALWDVVFGSLATLIGAVGAYLLRKRKWLIPLPTVISNTLIIPPVLISVYGASEAYIYLCATVCLGEILSVYGMGMLLMFALEKNRHAIFK